MLLFWMVGCNLSSSITPKRTPSSQVDPTFYKSIYSGQAISNPESLSGAWQMDDGQGGAVGIELALTTSLSDAVRTSTGGPEAWEALQVGVFHRSSSTIRLGDENFFSDSQQGGNVRYEDGRLTLHGKWADLDLGRSARDGWVGRLHRKDFDRQVVLTRGDPYLGQTSPLIGTWRRQAEEARFSCLHIVQTGTTACSGWEDSHAIPGLLRYAPHFKRPPSVIQTYGEAILVSPQGSSVLRLDSPESLAGCCSHSSLAKLNGHVVDIFPLTQTGPWDGKDWKKMPGTSCMSIPKGLKKPSLLKR
jgi:hypothetical protein